MRKKKELLEEIGDRMDISVSGLEYFTEDHPTVIVANHTSMRDIFAVPYALPSASKIVLSARLMWKQDTSENYARRQLIENSLFGIPLEVHGGKQRQEIGLGMARQAICDAWPVIIFPEGAYTGLPEVTKGRTGAVRLLFEARAMGVEPQLLPIGIDTAVDQNALDSVEPPTGPTHITICEPVNYEDYFDQYAGSDDIALKKQSLRDVTDTAMRAIARQIKQPYVDDYIPLRPRTTTILESGEEVPIETAPEANKVLPI